MKEELTIGGYRHAEKPKAIGPEDITPEEIEGYKKEHGLDPSTPDGTIQQLIIAWKGGPFYAQKSWDSPLDPNDKTSLTYEGIRHAHDFADEVYRKAESSPEGRLCLFMASPAGRTMETMAVIEDRIRDLLEREKPEKLKAIGIDGLDITQISKPAMKDLTYFVFDHEPIKEMGPFSNPTLAKVSLALGPSETAGEMLWYARPDEVERVKEEIKNAHPEADPHFVDGLLPKDYQDPPEEKALSVLDHYIRLIDLMRKNLHDKPIDIYSIGHNMILDAMAIRLLGWDISADSVKKIGHEAMGYLEGVTLSISGDKVTVRFREMENALTLEDLRALRQRLKTEAAERRQQWAS